MAILPILELPHPILRKRARRVREINSSVLRLAFDMVDTLQHSQGVGLAANQVGQLRRIIVLHLPEEETSRIYINPEIVYKEGTRQVEEGCLSIPGYRGFIQRSVWIKFNAVDDNSRIIKLSAEDLLAQILEHEVDHLNGILYIDHLESHEMLFKLEPVKDESGQPSSAEGTNIESKRRPQSIELPASLEMK